MCAAPLGFTQQAEVTQSRPGGQKGPPPLAEVRCLFLSPSRVPFSETDLSVHTDLAYLQVSSL